MLEAQHMHHRGHSVVEEQRVVKRRIERTDLLPCHHVPSTFPPLCYRTWYNGRVVLAKPSSKE